MWSRPDPFAIVICTCNGERFLDEQMTTLRAQDGVAEIVVSDDASVDGTWAILGRHAAEDPRIRLNRNRDRLGVAANFEQAIRRAESPWIALADQDDVWLPGKLARIRARWDGSACLVHHASRKFRGLRLPQRFEHWARERRKFSGRDWRRLLYRNSVVGHTTVFRAGLAAKLAPFPESLTHDWWLGLGAALLGRVQFVDECLVHYRIHGHNAYHALGSRVRRLQYEHAMRLDLLRTLLARRLLPADEAGFAEDYLALLVDSRTGIFSWGLWQFYREHASVFFGGPRYEPSPFTCRRKSCLAAVAAMAQVPMLVDESGVDVVAPNPLSTSK